jgi:hypothetical protein
VKRRPDKKCPVCAEDFHPKFKRQVCCSKTCGAIHKHRKTHPEQRRAGLARMAERRAELRRQREQEILNGCKTLVEAFRAGQRLERKRWHAKKRIGLAGLREELRRDREGIQVTANC